MTTNSQPNHSALGCSPAKAATSEDAPQLAVDDWTINQAQAIVDQWIKTVGVRYFSELTNLAQLMEEVGEVARILSRTYGEQSFKASDQHGSLADELADIIFVVICLANQTGIDLQAALRANLEKKTSRDARRHADNEKLK